VVKIKAVILAAGEGKRLRPFTYTRPKVLIPIAGKTLLEHILSFLKPHSITEVVFIVNYMKDKIINYLGDGTRYGMKFTYVEQPIAKGTADALQYAETAIGDDDFLMIYGDILTHPDNISEILSLYYENNPDAVVSGIVVSDVSKYAALITEGEDLKKIIEKPPEGSVNSNLANAGIYIFNKKIFDAIRKTKISQRGEYELTDSIRILIEQGSKVVVSQLEKWWLDVGRPWNILDANKYLLEELTETQINGTIEENVTIKGPVYIGKDALIRSGSYIVGPVYIDDGADIGPNNFIRSYTYLGKNTRIGNACEVKGSVIFNNTHIAHLSYVGDSVIGEDVNFGAGTITANLRFDDKSVKVIVKGNLVDSKRRKLGAFVGDNVKTGIQSMLMPGVKIGPNSWIGPGVIVERDVPSNSIILLKASTESRKLVKK